MRTPTTDLSMWRRRARIVAYIQPVFYVLEMVAIAYMLDRGINTTAAVVMNHDKIKEQLERNSIPACFLDAYIWITWITIPIMINCIANEIRAAKLLLKATKQGENNLKLACCWVAMWRIVCPCFPILNVLLLCFYGVHSFLCIALELFFRGILHSVVCNYKSALEEATQIPSDLL